MKYAYSPATGEIINTTSPAEWMGTTTVAPPPYNEATEGCFWKDGAWLITQAEAKASNVDPKMIGIEFDGVMCSATGEDQFGLTAVFFNHQIDGDSFSPTRFDFSNGSSLVITKTNLMAFMSVWRPFRQSFFLVN